MPKIILKINNNMRIHEIYESKSVEPESFSGDMEEKTLDNTYYRDVLYTGNNLQLVVMSIEPGQEIGTEVHDTGDQFIRVEAGSAEFVIDGKSQNATDGDSVLIPAGVEHNVINTGDKPLKLYALYAPPEHPADTKQKTKED